jgi:uncharacterized membrane protein
MFEALLTLIGVIGFITLLVLYGAFSWGYVSHTFYGWFILPIFNDLPHFTVIQFVGFSLFLNTIIRHGATHIKDEYKDKTTEHVSVFLMPWLVLLFGWFIKIVLF